MHNAIRIVVVRVMTTAALLAAPLAALLPGLTRVCRGAEATPALQASFVRPPDSARPWVYWFWLNSNITRQGITADLEAMKRVGIGGVLIMEVDQGAPVGPVPFMSDQWRAMFKHVASEARRLGLEVNMNNDAGWNGSGGPWVPLDKAMQVVVTSQTRITGGKPVEIELPQPRAQGGFYRDISVLAFPTPQAEQAGMAGRNPRRTSADAAPRHAQLAFAEPFSAIGLDLKLSGFTDPCDVSLQVSQDGNAFRTVRTIKASTATVSATFEPTVARWFRVIASNPAVTPADFELRAGYRIENVDAKAMAWRGMFTGSLDPNAALPNVPADGVVASGGIVDLTERMSPDGRLAWDAPAGDWTVLRIGHAFTGAQSHPAPKSGAGPECDKLSKEGIEAHFAGMMGKLIADVGPDAGKSLVATHVDSWEVGAQNWTPRMRQEFQQRRGYDLWRFLPTLAGRVVDSPEVSERFLWDLRQTVSELVVENYIGHLRTLAHDRGLKLSMETYTTPANDMDVVNLVDEPISEFWWPDGGGLYWSVRAMASAGHVNNRTIVGAEAFTAGSGERWLAHPAAIKALGDRAFCDGVNRFIVHRYAMQPWTDDRGPQRRPGMTMGPWGVHYERTQTWWEQSSAWHLYVSRCQHMLRQGQPVADVLDLQPEGALLRFKPRAITGYDYDACSPQLFMEKLAVKDGAWTLPHGAQYRLLLLPEAQTMTIPMLRKIRDLVHSGAAILGNPPQRTPGLSGYPQADGELRQLALELWGTDTGVVDRVVGKGRVFRGISAEAALAKLGIAPDFSANRQLRWIHRRDGDTDIYFVASATSQAVEATCAFRVRGKRPELWWPDTGRTEQVAAYEEADGAVRLPIRFDPSGSAFVVFRPGNAAEATRIVSITRDGQPVVEVSAKPQSGQTMDNNQGAAATFTMAAWVRPEAELALPKEAADGLSASGIARNDALYPPPGHEVYTQTGHAGAGISAMRNGVVVYEHSAYHFAPVLVHAAPLIDWTHVAVVYRDGNPTLYLNGKAVRTGLKSRFIVHSGVGVQHGRTVESFRGDLGDFRQIAQALSEAQVVQLMKDMPVPSSRRQGRPIDVARGEQGGLELQVWQAGTYVLKTGDGKTREVGVPALPAPQEVTGPWDLSFQPNWGAPQQISLEKLISWTEHSEPGVKYYSGTATYSKSITIPPQMLNQDRRLMLDLGKVQVIAEVRLNGRDIGTLWKPPYRVDITQAAKAGQNALEIKVVNLWVNRMLGDEQLPEDSQRNANGTLKEWPQWLQDGKPSPAGRLTFTSWRLWPKNAPLMESGLLGPVRIDVAQGITLK